MSWVCKLSNGWLTDDGSETLDKTKAKEFTEQDLGPMTKGLNEIGLRTYKDFYFIEKGGTYDK